LTRTDRFEPSLSIVYIDEKSNKVAVNAEDKCSKKLSKMFKEQNVKDAVYKICAKYGIEYWSEDTVNRAVKEPINGYRCQSCSHIWNYGGINTYVDTCSHCCTRVSVRKNKLQEGGSGLEGLTRSQAGISDVTIPTSDRGVRAR
jgi:hypothetical protein